MKKVSIVVCSYNAGDDLRDCLMSLEKQDYQPREIIVVDDASTDGTADYLEQFRKQSRENVTIVTNRQNLGVAGARNIGIRHATGDIIAFLDSDCLADSKWISQLARVYECQQPAAVGGRIVDARINSIWSLANKGHDYVAAAEGPVLFIKGCNMSFDAALLKAYMFNDEIKYGYEEILLCDLLRDRGYTIYYTPQAWVFHRHRTSMRGVLRQKYQRGTSSVWYLRKRGSFFIYRRHFAFLAGSFILPFTAFSTLLFIPALLLFALFVLSLLREELIFAAKTRWEMALTLPFLILIEIAHCAGSCNGVVKYWLLRHGT